MEILVKTKLGGVEYNFNIDEKNEMDALQKAATLGNMPNYCTDCKNDEYFRLDSNKDKEGNIYVKVTCKKCGSQAKLGQYKTGGFFWHRFEKYVKPGTEETPKKFDVPEEKKDDYTPPPVKEGTDNDLPF